MKKFFSVAVAAVATAGISYAMKQAAANNGGVMPTFDKAREGAVNMFDAVKKHPATTRAAVAYASIRERISGSGQDNDDFRGENGDNRLAYALIAPSAEEDAFILESDPKPATEPAAAAA
jgi:hypothetical protein